LPAEKPEKPKKPVKLYPMTALFTDADQSAMTMNKIKLPARIVYEQKHPFPDSSTPRDGAGRPEGHPLFGCDPKWNMSHCVLNNEDNVVLDPRLTGIAPAVVVDGEGEEDEPEEDMEF
jgi:hypothetical protein